MSFDFSLLLDSIGYGIFSPPIPKIVVEPRKAVFREQEIVVWVDPKPIGGYQSTQGALTIEHSEQIAFADWSDENLYTLASVVKKISTLFAHLKIVNFTLYLENRKSSSYFVLLPHCGHESSAFDTAIKNIFKSRKPLSKNELWEIQDFYTGQNFNREEPDASPRKKRKQKRINERMIAIPLIGYTVAPNDSLMTYLGDLHYEIAPADTEVGSSLTGNRLSQLQRYKTFKIIQFFMKQLKESGLSDSLYFEGNGEGFREYEVRSSHLVFFRKFPEGLCERMGAIAALFSPYLFPFTHSKKDKLDLEQRVASDLDFTVLIEDIQNRLPYAQKI